jgi:hypothetical protein
MTPRPAPAGLTLGGLVSDAPPPPAGDRIDPVLPSDDPWSVSLEILPAAPVPPADVDVGTAANLRPLRAVGMAVTSSGDGATATIRITTR